MTLNGIAVKVLQFHVLFVFYDTRNPTEFMKLFYMSVIVAAMTLVFVACKRGNNKEQTVQAEREAEQVSPSTNEAGDFKIDFTMADIDGNQVVVLDEFAKHELTVIDFWASWCGPCRQEMPNLVKTYNEYKDKGLGIIGVSLDEDREQWTKAVKDMDMEWLQLSDLQGWHNAAARMYGIQAIPFTIVVDKGGYLVEAGLRGEQLHKLIAGRLGEEVSAGE